MKGPLSFRRNFLFTSISSGCVSLLALSLVSCIQEPTLPSFFRDQTLDSPPEVSAPTVFDYLAQWQIPKQGLALLFRRAPERLNPRRVEAVVLRAPGEVVSQLTIDDFMLDETVSAAVLVEQGQLSLQINGVTRPFTEVELSGTVDTLLLGGILNEPRPMLNFESILHFHSVELWRIGSASPLFSYQNNQDSPLRLFQSTGRIECIERSHTDSDARDLSLRGGAEKSHCCYQSPRLLNPLSLREDFTLIFDLELHALGGSDGIGVFLLSSGQ